MVYFKLCVAYCMSITAHEGRKGNKVGRNITTMLRHTVNITVYHQQKKKICIWLTQGYKSQCGGKGWNP